MCAGEVIAESRLRSPVRPVGAAESSPSPVSPETGSNPSESLVTLLSLIAQPTSRLAVPSSLLLIAPSELCW